MRMKPVHQLEMQSTSSINLDTTKANVSYSIFSSHPNVTMFGNQPFFLEIPRTTGSSLRFPRRGHRVYAILSRSCFFFFRVWGYLWSLDCQSISTVSKFQSFVDGVHTFFVARPGDSVFCVLSKAEYESKSHQQIQDLLLRNISSSRGPLGHGNSTKMALKL